MAFFFQKLNGKKNMQRKIFSPSNLNSGKDDPAFEIEIAICFLDCTSCLRGSLHWKLPLKPQNFVF